MNLFYLMKFKIYSLIILYQIFLRIDSKTPFDYPYSINLENDNILLIQKTGIDIYNKSLNKLHNIIEFARDEEISEEKFSKIAIKCNNEYILSIINDKMFIFNNKGNLLYKSEEKINNNQIIYSYSLTLLNITNNIFDYMLGYFDEINKLNLYLYRYDNYNKSIILLSSFKEFMLYCDPEFIDFGINMGFGAFMYDNYSDNPKLLSCEYMYNSNLYKYRIVCFYNYNNESIGTSFFYLNNETKLVQDIFLMNPNYLKETKIKNKKTIKYIKSEINNDRTLALVWWNIADNNQTNYIIYNISDYTIYKISTNKPEACINKEYGTKINEFQIKNQISFSCIVNDENIRILFYDKTDLTLTNNSFSINASCENKSGLSRVYFNDDKNYYIYSCFNNYSNQSYSDGNHSDGNDTDGNHTDENHTDENHTDENHTDGNHTDENHTDENHTDGNHTNGNHTNGNHTNGNHTNEYHSDENYNNYNKSLNNTSKIKEDEKKNNNIVEILIIIIVSIIIILLMIFIIKYKKLFKKNDFETNWNKVKEDEKLMKEIMSDLLPNDQ